MTRTVAAIKLVSRAGDEPLTDTNEVIAPRPLRSVGGGEGARLWGRRRGRLRRLLRQREVCQKVPHRRPQRALWVRLVELRESATIRFIFSHYHEDKLLLN